MLTKYFNMNNINNYISCYFSLSKLLLEKKKRKSYYLDHRQTKTSKWTQNTCILEKWIKRRVWTSVHPEKLRIEGICKTKTTGWFTWETN